MSLIFHVRNHGSRHANMYVLAMNESYNALFLNITYTSGYRSELGFLKFLRRHVIIGEEINYEFHCSGIE